MTDKKGNDKGSGVGHQSSNSTNKGFQDLGGDFSESLSKGGDPLIKPTRTSFMSRLRSNFFAGVVIAAPFGITAWLMWWLFTGPLSNVDQFVKKWFPNSGNQLVDAFITNFPFIGVVVAIFVLIFLGALTRNFIGSSILNAWERLVDSVPVVRNLYGFFKNVFETALQQSDRSFKEVALVEYPRPGVWAMSFVVGDAKGEVNEMLNDKGDDLVSIFVPTVPNPTSGFLLFVSRSSLRILTMSVEEAAKVVFSMGLVVPETQDPDLAVRRLEAVAEEISSEQDKPKRKSWLGGNSKAS